MNKKLFPLFFILSVLVMTSMACQFLNNLTNDNLPTEEPVATTTLIPSNNLQGSPTDQDIPAAGENSSEIRQWAASAIASSSYGDFNWAPEQATGKPDVSNCGDDSQAWASLSSDTLEWIELSFDVPVVPTEINIYQSYNPSQVVEVDIISLDGTTYIAWQDDPEPVDYCPDLMSITIDLDEEITIDKVVVIIDQSILGLGWTEIDAVELVGKQEGQRSVNVEPTKGITIPNTDAVPNNYEGWMAGSIYQGYLSVIVGETHADQLDSLIGLTGKRSTDSWKPRPDHADTFIFDLEKDKMLAWISVTTDGIVYKKGISANTHPSDFQLNSVNQATYDQLNAIYKRDQVIPYAVMANTIGHPGFLLEAYIRADDNMLVETIQWFNANGDRLSGAFYNGKLTGMAGLAFIPKQ